MGIWVYRLNTVFILTASDSMGITAHFDIIATPSGKHLALVL